MPWDSVSLLPLTLPLAVALALVIRSRWFFLIRVKGSSMNNTLRNGDFLLAAPQKQYRRGDVVICRYPRRVTRTFTIGPEWTLTWHTLFVKRLVALPGDSVEIREGKLYVNGEETPDPTGMGSAPRDFPPMTLGRDGYFVIGDNRASSHDSRAHGVGPLPASMIRGRVRWVLWPLGRIRRVR